MVTIIDYDAGNLKSVEKALEFLGEEVIVTSDGQRILESERIILPGVGSFGDAMEKISKFHLKDVIREAVEKQIPFLGICLGMQLLFEGSAESPGIRGLGILKGKIHRIPEENGQKVPHMGWNSLQFPRQGRLYEGMEENSYVYFVHSYYLQAEEPGIVVAQAEYGVNIHASVEKGKLFGCQFHPEKSSETGLAILKNFITV